MSKFFPVSPGLGGRRRWVRAVDEVSFRVGRGSTLGIVGESGSGKSTAARTALRLLEPTSGRIWFEGRDITRLRRRELNRLRRCMQVVFQDPHGSLNPRMTVRDLVAEPLITHEKLSYSEVSRRVVSLLELVGLGSDYLWRRPHEFSGGQCQRVAIARALAVHPRLVVLDEPTSSLDVSVQARILRLLDDLQSRLGMSYLFISHNLAVVRAMADFVAVMYAGKLMEAGPVDAVFAKPAHPYTRALLASVPSPDPDTPSGIGGLGGSMPDPLSPPPGCRFHPRCRDKVDKCVREAPQCISVSAEHVVWCNTAG